MNPVVARRAVFPVVALVSVLFTGCSSRMVPGGAAVSAHLKGGVHGGLQPVVGATVQLFDATAGGQALIASTVLSDASGSFSLTGLYTCPAASDQVYLTAAGGNSGSGENEGLVLMTAMGSCGT